MSIMKYQMKVLYFCFFAVLIFCGVFTYWTYTLAVQGVDNEFPELVRIVAEDNCLDNTVLYDGKTMYTRYRERLDFADSSNNVLTFESDAIDVQYLSMASAPQKGGKIKIRLRGYWGLTFPIGNIPIHFPINREFNVTGIRNYRDR